MNQSISVTFPDATRKQFPNRTTVGEALAAWEQPEDELGCVGAMVNHDMTSLSFGLEVDSAIEPLTLHHPPSGQSTTRKFTVETF